ncbi:MAG TPA: hypothetical protein VGU61_21365 [Noviherbaspirillum sp.]|nr:hypothetical protein [Noviherbaspirillum sp.]
MRADHRFLDPVIRQMLAQSPPVRGLQAISKEMKGVVEHRAGG